jgi:thiol-disulfide isomerase/thioredoxin
MRKLFKNRKLRFVLEIALFVLFYLGLRAYLQWQLASGTLPAIQAQTLAGSSFDSRLARRGPLLIQFWATWCPVCRLEQGSIQAISHDYPVITIAMSSGDDAEIRRFLQREGLNFPVINDRAGDLARRFGVTGVPVSFVVDADNRIRFVERGYTTEWGLRLRLWLAG